MCGAFLIITKQMNMFNVPLSSRPFLAPYDDTATGRDRRKSTQHSAGTIPSFVPEADEGVAPMTPLLPSVAGDGVGLELGDGARIALSLHAVASSALLYWPALHGVQEESADADPAV